MLFINQFKVGTMVAASGAQSGFPKQFRKPFGQFTDWKFLLTVLIVLFLQIMLIVLFKSRVPLQIQPEMISDIQRRYAKTVLERDLSPFPAPPQTEGLDSQPVQLGDVLFAPVQPGGLGQGEAVQPGIAADAGPFSSPEASLPEAGAMASAGRSGGAGRSRTMADVASEVGNVGFLGLLTSGTGYVPEDYVSDISSVGESESQRLGEVLASLDAVQVSRGPEGKGWGGSDGKGNTNGPTGNRVVRGQRRAERAMSIDDLLGTLQPAAPIEFENIERTGDFERVASTIDKKPDTPVTEEEKERLRRKPDHVQSVINRHRPAITDCYKTALRTFPKLRGKIEVRLAIDPEGRVSWVEMINSTLKNQSLESCILNRISQWNDFGFGDPTAPDEVYRQTFTLGY
ncbi:AgmX/PglI C-terminal domain-containing protein [candidate division KSB1 bacterium]|nr:AgmX/PglI C-terminal domain-containing protein [candidate division KSB1 bacterium]